MGSTVHTSVSSSHDLHETDHALLRAPHFLASPLGICLGGFLPRRGVGKFFLSNRWHRFLLSWLIFLRWALMARRPDSPPGASCYPASAGSCSLRCIVSIPRWITGNAGPSPSAASPRRVTIRLSKVSAGCQAESLGGRAHLWSDREGPRRQTIHWIGLCGSRPGYPTRTDGNPTRTAAAQRDSVGLRS